MRKGQSLIEVMVALFVLTTGFLGILSLLAQSLYLSKNDSNETTATYLASEGIELAKNLIDHDVYNHIYGVGTGWGTCFTPSGGDYELDYTTMNCPPHSFSSSDFLEYDPASHTYLYNFDDLLGGGTPTPFTRLIRMTPNGPNEITVESKVLWTSGSAQENVDLEDHFYNWVP